MRTAHPQPQPGRTREIIQHGRLAWGFAVLNRAAMRSRAQGVVGRIPDIDGVVGRDLDIMGVVGRDLDAQSLPDGKLSPENADSVRNAPESGATRTHQTRANARASTRAAPACSRLARAARSVAPVVMTSSSRRRRLPATGSTTSYKPCACFWRSARPRAR